MSGSFRDAVELMKRVFDGNVKDGEITLLATSPEEILLELAMQIKSKDGTYDLTEGQAIQLLFRSEHGAGAFDLACKVCAVNIRAEKALPEAMRIFCSEVLIGMMKRPSVVRRDATWLENIYKLAMVRFVAANFGMYQTRGDNNSTLSACDAVAVALSELGVEVTYGRLKKLCVDPRHSALRAEAENWLNLQNAMEPFSREAYPAPASLQSYVPSVSPKGDTPEGN
jgi:hypothetical protein